MPALSSPPTPVEALLPHHSLPRAGGDTVARLLVRRGVISAEQLAYARRVQTKLVTVRPLVTICQQLNFLSPAALAAALRADPPKIRLGELLVELGRVQPAELDTVLAMQAERGGQHKLGDLLVEHGFIEETALVEILAGQLGCPFVIPDYPRIDRELLGQLPAKLLVTHGFLPVTRDQGRIVVAFADPYNRADREAAERIFGRQLFPAIAPRRALRLAADLHRRSGQRAPAPTASDSTVVGLINVLLDDAMQQGASDIHIEPLKDRLRVRFRRDGVLAVHRELDLDLAAPVTTRLKVLAEADIAERRRHQDGRILYESPATGQPLDLRVSFYITVHGEKIVLRLLNKQGEVLAIDDLGMAPRMLQRFREEALSCPSGIMLVTGPTGAGKTTTLYSCVNALNDAETSVITAEEPVESLIDGIAQCSINPKIGVTFTETLRHIVRQDPDVIVMGEVRDAFSAETAIQAALTGHKVLTTFHTEDTVGGLLRLLTMGIEPFLIASTVTCILAQRLLRRICRQCAAPYLPGPEEYRRLGYCHGDLAGAELLIGRGCSACRFTGYRGRVGIFELLLLDDQVKAAVMARHTAQAIRRASITGTGMVTLLEDGILKAAAGKVALPEMLKRLPRLERPRPLPELRRLLGG